MKRLVSAFFNSVAGLRDGFANEAAVRQEMIAIAISIPIVPLLTLDPWKMLLLWGALLFVLLTELLNTGIEEVANKVTREFAPEIKIAKDCGSAAVLIATLIAAAIWTITLWEWWFG